VVCPSHATATFLLLILAINAYYTIIRLPTKEEMDLELFRISAFTVEGNLSD